MIKSFSKTFTTFETGIKVLVELMPDLSYYLNPNLSYFDEVTLLLDIIKDNIPSMEDPEYPNTLSMNISAEEVSFKTDDGIIFGWKANYHDKSKEIISYDFNITFLNIPRSKQRIIDGFITGKWREISDDAETSGWGEIRPINWSIDENKSIPEEKTETYNVSSVQEKPQESKYFNANPLPVYNESDEEEQDENNNDDSNIPDSIPDVEEAQPQFRPVVRKRIGLIPKQDENEEIDEETKPQFNPVQRKPLGLFSKQVEDESDSTPIQEDDYQSQNEEQEEPRPKSRLNRLFATPRNRQPMLSQAEEVEETPNQEIIEEEVEILPPEDEEQYDERRQVQQRTSVMIRESHIQQRQTILPNGRVVQNEIEEDYNNEPRELDSRLFRITPGAGDSKTEVMITYQGKTTPLNIYESHPGIIHDWQAKTLLINQKYLYDYRHWTVTALSDDYEPDQATYVHNVHMENSAPVPDEAFVPEDTIIRNRRADIDAIQEEAAKRREFKDMMAGIKSDTSWKNTSGRTESPIIASKQQSGLPRRRGSFVLEKPQALHQNPNINAGQSVQIFNDERPQFRGEY